MVAPFGRQATLTMIISYNDSDWTTGWNHLLKGATMFLTPSYEQVWAHFHIPQVDHSDSWVTAQALLTLVFF